MSIEEKMKAGLARLLGGKDLEALQKEMQEKLKAAEHLRATGVSGGGVVKATVNGRLEVLEIEVEESMWQEPKTVVLGLIAGAVNQAQRTMQGLLRDQLGGT